MEFRTIVIPEPSPWKLTNQSAITLLGSCFSTSIAERLQRQLFNIASNPFGPLYNPESILSAVRRLESGQQFSEDELIENGDRYFHPECHTKLSSGSASELTDRLNRKLTDFKIHAEKSDAIFLTFGTSKVYESRRTGKIVANCHKLPASEFNKRLLTVDEATTAISTTIALLRRINPDIKIVLTLSPIRHLSDGAHENSISKATLLLAVSHAAAHTGASYFPSYEIVMDDLRDYRFYATDMAHPSDQAADYIYERFCQTYFSAPTIELARRFEKIARRLSHRPNTTDAELLQQFHESTRLEIKQLLSTHPYLETAINKLSTLK